MHLFNWKLISRHFWVATLSKYVSQSVESSAGFEWLTGRWSSSIHERHKVRRKRRRYWTTMLPGWQRVLEWQADPPTKQVGPRLCERLRQSASPPAQRPHHSTAIPVHLCISASLHFCISASTYVQHSYTLTLYTGGRKDHRGEDTYSIKYWVLNIKYTFLWQQVHCRGNQASHHSLHSFFVSSLQQQNCRRTIHLFFYTHFLGSEENPQEYSMNLFSPPQCMYIFGSQTKRCDRFVHLLWCVLFPRVQRLFWWQSSHKKGMYARQNTNNDGYNSVNLNQHSRTLNKDKDVSSVVIFQIFFFRAVYAMMWTNCRFGRG